MIRRPPTTISLKQSDIKELEEHLSASPHFTSRVQVEDEQGATANDEESIAAQNGEGVQDSDMPEQARTREERIMGQNA